MGKDMVKISRDADGEFNVKRFLDGWVCGKGFIKSKLENNIHFAAVKQDLGYGSKVYCIVTFIDKIGDETDGKDELTLVFKSIPEIMGPLVDYCPKEIYDLLSPIVDGEDTLNCAKEWRQKCEEFFKLPYSKQREIVTGLVVKSYRVNKVVAQEFKEYCDGVNLSQSVVLNYLMYKVYCGDINLSMLEGEK